TYLLAFAIVALGTSVQSSVGFGANLIAMPMIALFAPELVPGASLFAISAMNVMMLVRDRKGIEFGPVSNALIGRVGGTIAGALVIGALSDRGLRIVIALAVLAMVVISSVTTAPRRTRPNMIVAGTVSGFGAVTAGIGGPPVALMFQSAEGKQIRGSMGGFFVVGTAMTLVGLAIAGEFGLYELKWGALLVPAAVVGFVLSRYLIPIVDRGYTRPAILSLSAASAIVLLARALL
ncbi:MAG: sulfite exporter TauE/SafE family protein, partial [Acidimicrobiales bacterium]|nr:sulfite exporter TauE/SafE family protein [Acidimicrobiales bacterium]